MLFDMLALADYWGIADFKASIERDLATHLSPQVYQNSKCLTMHCFYNWLMGFISVRIYAEQYHADGLVQTCVQWEERNQEALMRVGTGRVDDDYADSE